MIVNISRLSTIKNRQYFSIIFIWNISCARIKQISVKILFLHFSLNCDAKKVRSINMVAKSDILFWAFWPPISVPSNTQIAITSSSWDNPWSHPDRCFSRLSQPRTSWPLCRWRRRLWIKDCIEIHAVFEFLCNIFFFLWLIFLEHRSIYTQYVENCFVTKKRKL